MQVDCTCFCMCFSMKSDHVLVEALSSNEILKLDKSGVAFGKMQETFCPVADVFLPPWDFFWHSWHEPQYVIPKLVSLQWLATGYPRGKQGEGLSFKVFGLNRCCLLPPMSENLNCFACNKSFPNKCMENGSFSHLTKGRWILLPWEMWCADWYCKIMYCYPSLSSWLEEDDDPVVAKVNQRMQQITGLTVKTAELLQVGALASSWWN